MDTPHASIIWIVLPGQKHPTGEQIRALGNAKVMVFRQHPPLGDLLTVLEMNQAAGVVIDHVDPGWVERVADQLPLVLVPFRQAWLWLKPGEAGCLEAVPWQPYPELSADLAACCALNETVQARAVAVTEAVQAHQASLDERAEWQRRIGQKGS